MQPLAELQQEDQTFIKSQFHSQCTEDLPRVLETARDTTTDQLVFTFESLTSYLEEEVITKRVILSSIAKRFDPLGILSPLFAALKILFQKNLQADGRLGFSPGGGSLCSLEITPARRARNLKDID